MERSERSIVGKSAQLLNSVNIQPDAVADSEEAAGWYENQQPGLGVEFILELDAAYEKAAGNPAIYETQYREIRRVLLRRFPYSVYFVYENGVVEIFAVLHQQRSAAAWQDRIR